MSGTEANSDPNQNQPAQPPADSRSDLPRVVVGTEWHGPLPPPHVLAEYERQIPGSSDRILTMGEKGQQHRIDKVSNTVLTWSGSSYIWRVRRFSR